MKIRQGKFTGNKFKAYGWRKYALSIGNIEWKSLTGTSRRFTDFMWLKQCHVYHP